MPSFKALIWESVEAWVITLGTHGSRDLREGRRRNPDESVPPQSAIISVVPLGFIVVAFLWDYFKHTPTPTTLYCVVKHLHFVLEVFKFF